MRSGPAARLDRQEESQRHTGRHQRWNGTASDEHGDRFGRPRPTGAWPQAW